MDILLVTPATRKISPKNNLYTPTIVDVDVDIQEFWYRKNMFWDWFDTNNQLKELAQTPTPWTAMVWGHLSDLSHGRGSPSECEHRWMFQKSLAGNWKHIYIYIYTVTRPRGPGGSMKYQFVYLNVVTVCLNELDSVCLNGPAGQGKLPRR